MRSRRQRPSGLPTVTVGYPLGLPCFDRSEVPIPVGSSTVRVRRVGCGAAAGEDRVVKDDRIHPAELVCVDCGRDLDPDEAIEVHLPTRVMKVCPACMGQLRRLDGLRE
jgi:hypothetical protein